MPLPPLPTEDLDHVLEHTRDLWEELRGQRLFITGGTGFFGVWLVESFLWANERLGLRARATVLSRAPAACLARLPHLASHPALSFQTGDVRSYAFPEGRFSHVIHAATQASAKLNADDPLAMFDTIVEGTRRTLEFAAHTGTRKFLLTSSGAVYGKQPPQLTLVAEDYPGAPDPMEPCTVYGQGKRAAEHLGALYSRLHEVEVKIARGFAFVGPHLPLDAHFAIGNFISDALRGDPVNVQGDGTPYRSYLYAADLTIWLWTILFRGQSCRPYNVGSDESLNIAALAQRVDQWLGPRGVRIARSSTAAGPAERYVPDIGRARRELDLKVQVSLEVAVRRTAAYSKLGSKPG